VEQLAKFFIVLNYFQMHEGEERTSKPEINASDLEVMTYIHTNACRKGD
jgi:hypothetical protein